MSNGFSHVWPWNPGGLAVLLILCLLYVIGLRQAHKRYIRDPQEKPVRWYHVACFFSAIIIAGPLILLGSPGIMLRPLVELPIIDKALNVLMRPLVASIIFNVCFIVWHTPVVYDIAMNNEALYHLQMLMLFLLSFLNWWPIMGSVDELRWMSYPMEMLYVFFDGIPFEIFAFLLVFSGTTIYPHYSVPPGLGLPEYSDQAASGAMLLFPGVVDLIIMTPLFFKWLNQMEQHSQLEDQRRLEEMQAEEEEHEEYEDGEEEVLTNVIEPEHQAG
jgi:cytochrome c oxidase assembly factor CtaG